MTPQAWFDRVVRLVTEGKDEQALEFSGRLASQMLPRLSREQFVQVTGLLAGAQLVVDMSRAAAEQQDGREEARPTGDPPADDSQVGAPVRRAVV